VTTACQGARRTDAGSEIFPAEDQRFEALIRARDFLQVEHTFGSFQSRQQADSAHGQSIG